MCGVGVLMPDIQHKLFFRFTDFVNAKKLHHNQESGKNYTSEKYMSEKHVRTLSLTYMQVCETVAVHNIQYIKHKTSKQEGNLMYQIMSQLKILLTVLAKAVNVMQYFGLMVPILILQWTE